MLPFEYPLFYLVPKEYWFFKMRVQRYYDNQCRIKYPWLLLLFIINNNLSLES